MAHWPEGPNRCRLITCWVQHEPPRIVGNLMQSEIAQKQARYIRYQMTIAKLPLAKDIDN